jgi:hypothetical protein
MALLHNSEFPCVACFYMAADRLIVEPRVLFFRLLRRWMLDSSFRGHNQHSDRLDLARNLSLLLELFLDVGVELFSLLGAENLSSRSKISSCSIGVRASASLKSFLLLLFLLLLYYYNIIYYFALLLFVAWGGPDSARVWLPLLNSKYAKAF